MTTHPTSSHPSNARRGFTLVELLVGMTVIAILAGILSVAVSRAFTRAREFAIQMEMTQIEQALEQFQIEYGFYPPSFKEFAEIEKADGADAAATHMLTYLNRISPNHGEGVGSVGDRPVDMWYAQVGMNLNPEFNPGADLVFWLSGLSRNRQFPLTANGNPLAAHNSDPTSNVERQVFYEFNAAQLNINGLVANYSQNDRKFVPYLYLDAKNYLPTGATSNDGAYCYDSQTLLRAFNGDSDAVSDALTSITDGTINQTNFKLCYPNPDSFQLVTFGLDAAPGQTQAPNQIDKVMNFGADNFVNFGANGPARLDTVLGR